MTDQKPTGVFVRLPLSEDQIVSVSGWIPGNREELRNEVLPSIFSAIGAPVHGEGIPVVGTIHIGENGKPFFTAPELYSTGGDVVRQSDALAKLAEKDAEIARYREALIEAKIFHEEQDKSLSKQPPSSQGSWRRNLHQEQIEQIETTLKGGAA